MKSPGERARATGGFVLRGPRAAAARAEARFVRVGLVHHASVVHVHELAEPQAELRAGLDRSGLGRLVFGLLAQQTPAAHQAHHALVHAAGNLADLARQVDLPPILVTRPLRTVDDGHHRIHVARLHGAEAILAVELLP